MGGYKKHSRQYGKAYAQKVGHEISALRQLCHQLPSVEWRAKCPTVPQCRDLVTGTLAA